MRDKNKRLAATSVVTHLRGNAVAYVALFFALASGSAIAANTISSTDIVNGEVKSVDIGTGAVASVDIATDAVEHQDILDDEVKYPEIDNGAVRSSEIQNGSVASGDLGTGSVGAAQIADGTVGPDERGVGIYARVTGATTDSATCPPIPDDTETPIPWEVEDYDTAALWLGHPGVVGCTEASKLYAPRRGVYAVSAGLRDDNTTGARSLAIVKTHLGETSYVVGAKDRPDGSDLIQNLSAEVSLEAGDYVQLVLHQTTGSTLSHPFFEPRNFLAMSWIGPLPAPAVAGATESSRGSR